MKKLLLILMTLLPLVANAYNAYINGIYYNFSGNEATVTYKNTNYNSYSGAVVIPKSVTYNGTTYKVTCIGNNAFYGSTNLTSITIPSTLTRVMTGAFRDCHSLSKVIISDIAAWCGITYDGDDYNGDFPLGIAHHLYSDEYTEITKLTIPSTVTRIEARAFRDAEFITSVTLPGSITNIGAEAFRGMRHLESINIPSSVTNIGENAFTDCSVLQKVIVPDIAAWCGIAFGNNYANPLDCAHHLYSDENTEIKDLVIPNSVTTIKSGAFYGCRGLTSVTIPNSIKQLNKSTFAYCSGLKSIILPNSITSIGDYVFYGCDNIEDFYCYSTSVPSTANFVFDETNVNLATLHVPSNSVNRYKSTSPWSSFGLIKGIGEAVNTETVEIATAEELAYFAARVNSGETSLNAILKDDIDFTTYPDVMIGENIFYRGEFDGAGHSIKLALKRTSENAALFGYLLGYIHDLTTTGTITTSNKFAAGIVAQTWNCVIERCQSRVNIISSVNGDGTHGGIIGISHENTIVRDCLFCGSFIGSLTNCWAGISGWAHGNSYISNCLILGDFNTGVSDNDLLARNSSNIVSSNNFFRGEWDAITNCSNITRLAEYQVKSGETCFHLNNGRMGGDMVWYQTIGTDDFPVPDNRHLSVLSDGYSYFNNAADNIIFADLNVKALCVANWDTNGDGGLSHSEAASVTNIGTVFQNNTKISSFDELQYFTGLTSISNNAFRDCKGLTRITLPNGITSIGNDAFRDCHRLASITIPNNVTYISDGAFWACRSLTSITIPDSVTGIGVDAFNDCKELVNVIIGDGVTNIGGAAFYACSNLTSVNIGNGVKSIVGHAFYGCGSLTSITIPENVTSIGDYAFHNCSNLTTVILESDAVVSSGTSMKSLFGNQVKKYVLGGDVETIGNNAFYECTEMTTITIPSTLKRVKMGAFYNCHLLSKVIVPDVAAWCGIIYEGEDPNCDFPLGRARRLYSDENTEIKGLVIPEGVTRIEALAFRDAEYITSVTLPNSLTSIGLQAFCGTSHLPYVTIPNNVTSIGNNAFQGCLRLTYVIIPESVTSIGEYAFDQCYELSSVKIGGAVPVELYANSFPTRPNATLYVPIGSKSLYSIANYWRDFKKIVEFPNTDVNQDNSVDVLDVVDIARYVVGSPAESFVEFLADINYDGIVNLGDAVLLVNAIAGSQNFVKGWGTPRVVETDDALTLIERDGTQSLFLKNGRFYTAFQFDLYVHDGTDVKQMLLNAERNQGHQLLYNKVENGHYRVAALSIRNNEFNGNDGELLNIVLSNAYANEVNICNICFFDTEGNKYLFDDIVGAITTDLIPALSQETKDIYDLQGRKHATLQHGINIVGGKKVIVK